ncbi:AraC family transcriptional regulator [Flavobacterium zhairuonense]|uniref:helix-turn-helix domain-containing protein n=1 Tax=Flavobacterium zhairuonense TaxID=2493631 RepID=UPI001044A060|nr:helix-turn-helix domain-containing protein [Flavobacterium zhairuonense]KAF2508663.1 AraC family transcriptional regulator [Flavobacterium zhairuonense]
MADLLLPNFFMISGLLGSMATFILTFHKREKPNIFLSIFLCSLAIVSFFNFYWVANSEHHNLVRSILVKSLIFLTAPCAYLYVRSILFPERLLRKDCWVHFMPFGIYSAFACIGLIGRDSPFHYDIAVLEGLLPVLCVMVCVLYGLCQTMMILNFQFRGKDREMDKSEILSWVRIFNLFTLFLFSGFFVNFFISKDGPKDLHGPFLISLTLMLIAGWLYFKPDYLHAPCETVARHDKKRRILAKEKIKAERYLLKSGLKDYYTSCLKKAFEEEKLFLKPGLCIRDVSEQTAIRGIYISMIIHLEYQMEFQVFVNRLRISYFKENVDSAGWRKLTLQEMADASGFASRTTFFRTFVKYEGMPPSEYLRNKKAKASERSIRQLPDLRPSGPTGD